MKYKIFFGILSFLTLIILVLVAILYQNNIELKLALNKQIKVFNNTKIRDSVYTEKNKKYSQVITKYVNDSEFMLGNHKISDNDFVNLYNHLDLENLKRKDSIQYLKEMIDRYKALISTYQKVTSELKKQNQMTIDSAFNYTELYKYSKDLYGFNTFMKKDSSNSYVISHTFSKADSAALLFKYFKGRIKETSPGIFSIDISGGPVNNVKEKKIK